MTRSFVWPVSMTVRFHLFPFRTQKLSSLVPKIVGWRRPVKIGRCRLLNKAASGPSLGPGPEFALYAPLAQLVEQLTLNQWVLGSSPRWCTKKSLTENVGLFFIAITRNVELVHHRRTRTARARRPLRRANRVRWTLFRARESPRGKGRKAERSRGRDVPVMWPYGKRRALFYCNNPER